MGKMSNREVPIAEGQRTVNIGCEERNSPVVSLDQMEYEEAT